MSAFAVPVLLLCACISVAADTRSQLAGDDFHQVLSHRHSLHSALKSSVQADLSRVLSSDDARHLLARTGIGVKAADLQRFTGMTRRIAVDRIIAGFDSRPALPMPAWVSAPLPRYYALQDMDDNTRAAFDNERDAEMAQLRQWWILSLLLTSTPQTERMVLFWHDLFASSYTDLDRMSLSMARQNQTFREKGMGSWEALLLAMIRDPALLLYLDAPSNRKESPNENLARELLELFTLGEGNYDETLVREAARSLTGYGFSYINDLAFELRTWDQDSGDKELFGQRGAFAGDDLVRLILRQDAAARFLAARFWHAFISDAAPDPLWLQAVATGFSESGHDIATLYRKVLESDAFWAGNNRGMLIKSPVDLVLGTARSLQYPLRYDQNLASWLSVLGMKLFAPPDVSGWKEGASFVTPGRLLARYDVVDSLLAAGSGLSAGPVHSQVGGQRLQLRLAAENYRGPVEYQVSVHDAAGERWVSAALPVAAGQDTQRHGRIEDQSELYWHTVSVPAPGEVLDRAQRIDIGFLNDAAGPDGDRNLFVDGLFLDDHWYDSRDAGQQSDCTPLLQADAGKLYCSGRTSFDIQPPVDSPANVLPGWRAAGAHVLWASHDVEAGSLQVDMILDDLVTPTKAFHSLQFSLAASAAGPLRLQMNSYGCWPECLELWPACAWRDEQFPSRRYIEFLRLPLRDTFWQSGADEACHLAAIDDVDRELASVLWHNAASIVRWVRSTPGADGYSQELMQMAERLEFDSVELAQTPYALHAAELHIDPAHASLAAPRASLSLDQFVSSGPDSALEWLAQLAEAGIEPARLLMPMQSFGTTPGLAPPDATPVKALQALVRNPAFQLK